MLMVVFLSDFILRHRMIRLTTSVMFSLSADVQVDIVGITTYDKITAWV